MSKEILEKEGTVIKAMTAGSFRVELDGTHEEVLAVISGKIRKFRIRVLPGDRVKLEFSPHDLSLGRITYRYR